MRVLFTTSPSIGEFAGPIAAALDGLPSATHAFGSLTPRERVAAAATEVAELWEAQGLEPRPYGGLYDHIYLDIYPPSLQSADSSHVHDTEPLRPVAFAASGGEPLPDWLGDHPTVPLVYVTFGMVFNRDVEVIGTVIEAVRELPVRVVVTVGPNGDPAVFGQQPDNVHIARYIPQTALLEFCAAVVSHAGSGTFLAALARGLPQLCLPQAADQFINAAACDRAGGGITIQPNELTLAVVRRAVQQILEDEQILANAQRIAGEIEAMPGPEAVAARLQERFGG